MENELNNLKARLKEVNDIQSAAAVLGWDQSTYMPPESAAIRGQHLATLGRIAH